MRSTSLDTCRHERKLSGQEEALLVATACSKPPPGRARWTLEFLAGELIKLTEHEDLSRETVRRRPAENDLKPWRKDMWCVPKIDGEYVAPHGGRARSLRASTRSTAAGGCFDESPTQLIGEVRQPIPAKPGNSSATTANIAAKETVNTVNRGRRIGRSRVVSEPCNEAAAGVLTPCGYEMAPGERNG
jgi:hypothetical protein